MVGGTVEHGATRTTYLGLDGTLSWIERKGPSLVDRARRAGLSRHGARERGVDLVDGDHAHREAEEALTIVERAIERHGQASGGRAALPVQSVRRGKKNRGGRPPKGPRSSERHEVRARLRARSTDPHRGARLRGRGSLRQPRIYNAIQTATATVAERHDDFRIVHASIQGNHLNLIVEASDKMRLARGMQAFQISAAKRINRAASRLTGERHPRPGVPDRYHATLLTTPRQVRAALAFVLNGWRRRGEDQRGEARRWTMDPFSSAAYFDGWKERASAEAPPQLDGVAPLVVSFPKSELLSTGWRRHGLIELREVPTGKVDHTR